VSSLDSSAVVLRYPGFSLHIFLNGAAGWLKCTSHHKPLSVTSVVSHPSPSSEWNPSRTTMGPWGAQSHAAFQKTFVCTLSSSPDFIPHRMKTSH
jgi:hypothetical protein